MVHGSEQVAGKGIACVAQVARVGGLIIAEVEITGALLAFVVVLIGSTILPTDVEGVLSVDIEEVVFCYGTELAIDGIRVG